MEEQNVSLLAKAESHLTDEGCNFTDSPAFFFVSGTVIAW